MTNTPLVHVLVGPTASGKTAAGIVLAKKIDGEIISADSRQLYAGMNIGTAKPEDAWATEPHDILKADMVESVPHYLFNVSSPTHQWSLPDWQGAAKKVLADIVSRGKKPIIVGGTMLYVDSIVKNFDIPHVEENMELREQLESQDTETLYKRLIEADPEAQKFIEPHHKRRIIRALEVIEATHKPFSAARQMQPSPYTFTVQGILPSWDELKKRITARIQAMMSDGLLDEVTQLQAQYGASLPLLETMNYLQARQVLAGTMTKEAASEEMIRVNMRYARRQMSWWKRNKDIQWDNTPKQS